MFHRIKTWLSNGAGLREATRDAAREATREGLTEGFRLGVEDFIQSVSIHTEPVTIEVSKPLTAADLKGKRKADLLELASERGLNADESWTVAELTEELINC